MYSFVKTTSSFWDMLDLHFLTCFVWKYVIFLTSDVIYKRHFIQMSKFRFFSLEIFMIFEFRHFDLLKNIPCIWHQMLKNINYFQSTYVRKWRSSPELHFHHVSPKRCNIFEKWVHYKTHFSKNRKIERGTWSLKRTHTKNIDIYLDIFTQVSFIMYKIISAICFKIIV